MRKATCQKALRIMNRWTALLPPAFLSTSVVALSMEVPLSELDKGGIKTVPISMADRGMDVRVLFPLNGTNVLKSSEQHSSEIDRLKH